MPLYSQARADLEIQRFLCIILKNETSEQCFQQGSTFHVPNLIPLIKYMKRSTFESIKFNMCNLGRPKFYPCVCIYCIRSISILQHIF